MSVYIREVQDYQLSVGSILLHMSEYKIIGGCLLSEQGTASGWGTVTACFPKGTRITMKGKLPPSVDMDYLAGELESLLHSDVKHLLLLGRMTVHNSRLVGYTFSEGEDFPVLTLMYYSSDPFPKEVQS